MLALSPPLFSTTYGWPLNLITQDIQQDCNETNSYHDSLLDYPSNIQIQHDFAPEISISNMSSKGALYGNNDNPMKVAKKLNDNASERDRRKRVNELYSFLRSLLPVSSDRTKKVSIPGIVSHALKYIPELQQEVERLKSKKEKLVSCSSSRNIRNLSAKETMIRGIPSSMDSFVSVIGGKVVVIQLIFPFDDMNKNKNIGLLSKALEYLEEEHSLVLLNANTFKCLGKERLLSTLHFQVHREGIIEAEKLKEKLCSLSTKNDMIYELSQ